MGRHLDGHLQTFKSVSVGSDIIVEARLSVVDLSGFIKMSDTSEIKLTELTSALVGESLSRPMIAHPSGNRCA